VTGSTEDVGVAGAVHGAPRGGNPDPASCITCSDALLEVVVERISQDGTWAEGTCAGESCSISIELVADVRPGDVVLTQGGVALQFRDGGRP